MLCVRVILEHPDQICETTHETESFSQHTTALDIPSHAIATREKTSDRAARLNSCNAFRSAKPSRRPTSVGLMVQWFAVDRWKAHIFFPFMTASWLQLISFVSVTASSMIPIASLHVIETPSPMREAKLYRFSRAFKLLPPTSKLAHCNRPAPGKV
jgi:hypothetical protein